MFLCWFVIVLISFQCFCFFEKCPFGTVDSGLQSCNLLNNHIIQTYYCMICLMAAIKIVIKLSPVKCVPWLTNVTTYNWNSVPQSCHKLRIPVFYLNSVVRPIQISKQTDKEMPLTVAYTSSIMHLNKVILICFK